MENPTGSEQDSFERPVMIVAVGASAGGLEAFQKFLGQLPKDSGMAFVLLQHLDPSHETLMPELLKNHSPVPIEQVKDHKKIEADHIYFIPPNATLTLENNHFKVEKPKQAHGHRMPIDIFFRSLAEHNKENSVAVVLSGTGSDGSVGIKAVKEAGGLTFAQDPETSRYESMPKNAIGTGMIDYILPVEEISKLLVDYVRHRFLHSNSFEEGSSQANAILKTVCRVIYRLFNHDFSEYKKNTLIRRIYRRMQMKRITEGAKYLELITSDVNEAKALFHDFLIGVTYFFRDPAVFETLQKQIIPEILKKEKDIRVWVAGCATGEEAYSLAILFVEAIEELNLRNRKVQIFATDIDEKSLTVARRGLYPEGIVEHVSRERLKRFFVHTGTSYEVIKPLREMCLFSKHDLLRDPPFARVNLVSCRNLLIYLGPELQKAALGLFSYSLKTSNYLVLGPAESVNGSLDQFKEYNKEHKIFVNKVGGYLPRMDLPLKFAPQSVKSSQLYSEVQSSSLQSQFSQKLERMILRHWTPPHVVVNKDYEVRFFSNNLDGLVMHQRGAPSTNLIPMVNPSIRSEIRSCLAEAIENSRDTSIEMVPIRSNNISRFVDIIIKPLGKDRGREDLFLVVFQPSQYTVEFSKKNKSESPPDGTSDYQRLKKELEISNEQLRLTTEELEYANEELRSSNEELLSMNEEMQSGNEELQTSHEEMQSINEELETVNAELSSKVSLLDAANSDLENLFRSTEIATLFLDTELKVKRFTPQAKIMFSIRDTDVERPITDLAPKFEGVDLKEELSKVLQNLETRTREVKLPNKQEWFKLQMHPYKTINNFIDGTILTFSDISELKKSQTELKLRLKQQTVVSSLGVRALDHKLPLVELFNEAVLAVQDVFEADYCKVLELLDGSKELLLVSGVGWQEGLVGNAVVGTELDSQAGYTLRSDHPIVVENFDEEKRFTGPNLLREHQVLSGLSVVIKCRNGKDFGVLGVHSKHVQSFTERDEKFMQAVANILGMAVEKRDLMKSKNLLADVVQSTHDIIISFDLEGTITSWNPAAEKAYGFSDKEAIGKSIFDLIVPDNKANELKACIEKLIQGKAIKELETQRVSKFGDSRTISLVLAPMKNDGKVVLISSIGRDISNSKKTRDLLVMAKEQADSANELKSRFMGVLSHELRTPLSAILGYTELIRKTNNLDPKVTDSLEKVDYNGRMLLSLVKDILDISKIEQGKVNLQREWFEPKNTFDRIISAFSAQALRKGITLHVEYSGEIPTSVFSDPLRIRQILANLISNGIKYSDNGEIGIAIRVSEREATTFLKIQVKDSGRGIDPEKQKDLFQPFYRAEPNHGASGIGLGLYLARSLAHHLGGNLVLLKSELGKGSRFEFSIPVEVSNEKEGESNDDGDLKSSINETSLQGVRILLADDSDDLRQLFVAFLEMSGATVDEARDGKEAMSLFLENKYDIVVLDLHMPEMNGDEVMQEIKKSSKKIPAIALTAHASKSVRASCLSHGFKDHISKPVSQEVLIKAILRNL